MIFDCADFDDHEEVVFVSDAAVGLRAIIAIHDTTLGPALGGCRMYPYGSDEEALRDVLRLSRGMSYKAALAEVSLGGGKSVIIGDPRKAKNEALLRAMGRAIDRLGGRYIAGEDIGTNPADMSILRQETRAVSCLTEEDGGYGDPAPLTALGVMQAIRAGLMALKGPPDLSGIRVAVQGVGNVGYQLCKLLVGAGALPIACDVFEPNLDRAAALGLEVVSPDEIFDVEADVFAPCATGAVLTDDTIPRLTATIIAGAANNQLGEARHADMLQQRDIIYIPDYVANSGGLISCAAEWYRTDPSAIRPKVLAIFDTCTTLVAIAVEEGITPSEAADRLGMQRLGRNDGFQSAARMRA